MEIDLNKEDSTETREFINFSMREYVAEIRSKDPKKCWPFGSLGDPDKSDVFTSYESIESTFLSSQNCPRDINGSDYKPEHIVAPYSFKKEIDKGEDIVCLKDMVQSLGNDDNLGKIIYNGSSVSTFSKVNHGQCRHENSVNEGAKIGQSVAVDDDEPGRNRLRKKPRKYRLLTDILKDPASELRAHCGIMNPENVNNRFFTETEDELDDNVTLDKLFRKQKGIEVTDPTLKKRRKTIRVEEPRVDLDVKSKHRLKESNHGLKESKHGLKDATGKDLDVVPRIRSRKKARFDDIDKQTMVKLEKDSCSQKMSKYTEAGNSEASKTENEDSEMEAVMLLARRFNDGNPLAEHKTDTACACVQKKIRERESTNVSVPKLIITKSAKTATKNYSNTKFQAQDNPTASFFQAHVEICFRKAAADVVREIVCAVNKNPADFSTPNAENMFMRGG